MPISGKMTKGRQLGIWFGCGFPFLCSVTFGSWIALRLPYQTLPLGLRIAWLGLFPAAGAMGSGIAWWWLGRRAVVEFTSDDSRLRFRKLGRARAETRALAEIARGYVLPGSYRDLGTCLVFQDGSEALLLRRLPGYGSLLGHLESRCQVL